MDGSNGSPSSNRRTQVIRDRTGLMDAPLGFLSGPCFGDTSFGAPFGPQLSQSYNRTFCD